MARKKQSGLGKGLDSLIPDFYDEDFDSNNSISLEDMLNDDKDIENIADETFTDTNIEEEVIEEDSTIDVVDDESSLDEDENIVDEEVEEEDVEIDSPVEDEIIEDESDIEEESPIAETEEYKEELEIDDESSIEEDEEVIEEDSIDDVDDFETEVVEEIELTEKDLENIKEVKDIVAKNPRITLWSAQSAAVFRYLRKTEPEFSISKEASLMIEEAVSKKYPEIWKLFDEED